MKYGTLVPCLQICPLTARGHWVYIGPGHCEYDELYAQNEAAGAALVLWHFETKLLRTPIGTFWAWLRGTP